MGILGKLIRGVGKGWEEGKSQHLQQTNQKLLELLAKLGIRAAATGSPQADIPANWALLLAWMVQDGFRSLSGQRPSVEKLVVALGIIHHIADMLCSLSGQPGEFRKAVTVNAAIFLFFGKKSPDYERVFAAAKKQDDAFYAKGHDKLMSAILDGVHGVFKQQDPGLRASITAGVEGLLLNAAPIHDHGLPLRGDV